MRLSFLAVLVVVLVAGAGIPAFAQQVHAVEVSGGYTFLRDFSVDRNAHGWVASVAGNYDRWFGVMGEVGGSYGSFEVATTNTDFDIYSFMGGPRFTFRSGSGVTPFVHFLAGGTTRSSNAGVGGSMTDAAMQLGGGLDVWARSQVGMRLGADYRHIFADRTAADQLRLQVSLVFGIGSR